VPIEESGYGYEGQNRATMEISTGCLYMEDRIASMEFRLSMEVTIECLWKSGKSVDMEVRKSHNDTCYHNLRASTPKLKIL